MFKKASGEEVSSTFESMLSEEIEEEGEGEIKSSTLPDSPPKSPKSKNTSLDKSFLSNRRGSGGVIGSSEISSYIIKDKEILRNAISSATTKLLLASSALEGDDTAHLILHLNSLVNILHEGLQDGVVKKQTTSRGPSFDVI